MKMKFNSPGFFQNTKTQFHHLRNQYYRTDPFTLFKLRKYAGFRTQ